jgi:hypothetical protein
MVKKILLNNANKTASKTARMEKVRRLLTSEGINIKTYDLRCGVIETEHTHIRFIDDTCSLLGFNDFDISFGFEDNVEYRLKSFPDKYPGTAIGYIVKTEAEETLKEEQEKLKRQQRLVINTMYGRGGLHLPDSDYSKEFVKYGEAVREGVEKGLVIDKNDVYAQYCKADVKATQMIYKLGGFTKPHLDVDIRKYIKKVVFNDPATIIFWNDDTKTVVKAEGEAFDPEKGLAMAIAKKALGNKHDYYNTFLKYLKKYTPSDDAPIDAFTEFKVSEFSKDISDIQRKVYDAFHLKKDTKRECVEKAYQTLINADKTRYDGKEGKPNKIDYWQSIVTAIGYLDDALKDKPCYLNTPDKED